MVGNILRQALAANAYNQDDISSLRHGICSISITGGSFSRNLGNCTITDASEPTADSNHRSKFLIDDRVMECVNSKEHNAA